MAGQEVSPQGDSGLFDGSALGRQAADLNADVLLQMVFTLQKEGTADPGELVRPPFGHLQRVFPDLFAIQKFDPDVQAHSSSPSLALNLSWLVRHSIWATSLRSPRYTGWYKLPLSLKAYR